MAGREGFDPRVYREASKKAGDEDRLFESLREMNLLESLELCRHWAAISLEATKEATDAQAIAVGDDAPLE